ncbi:maestro heat-like repeat-containing protein family member 1, partial [Passer domesticus]|uniref:maestro heat-like repeat-containing protein family member 1 n=1 Tax=Passer domesticus TaxID=48849 RepID=UPI0030FF21AB
LAAALLEASAEAEPEVREQLREALSGLGAAEPEELLLCCGDYLRDNDKLPAPQRALILLSMGAVVRRHLSELGPGAAAATIALAAQEMARAKEAQWEWQAAAAALLVELGRRFLSRVMEELLRHFPPAALPQPGVLRALADLACANVFGMVPFLSSILGTLLPLLGMARTDSMKCTLCYALQRFSESIQEYLAGQEQRPDPTIRGDAFAPELGATFETLSLQWAQSREGKVRLAVLEALGPMSSLLAPEQLQEQLPRLLPAVLGLYRRHPEPFPISKSLCQLLEAWAARGSRALEPHLEPLLAALLAQMCAPADPNIPTSSKNHTELLRCFSVLAGPFPERLVQWLLPRLESGPERHRQGAPAAAAPPPQQPPFPDGNAESFHPLCPESSPAGREPQGAACPGAADQCPGPPRAPAAAGGRGSAGVPGAPVRPALGPAPRNSRGKSRGSHERRRPERQRQHPAPAQQHRARDYP